MLHCVRAKLQGESMRRMRRVSGVLVTVCTWAMPAFASQQPEGVGPRTVASPEQNAVSQNAAEQNAAPDPKPTPNPDDIQPLFFNVTVTAPSRVSEETGKTPQAVTVATSDAIDRRQARTPNQMLREEPGVWSAQVSSQGSPIIRGQIGN